MSLSKTILDDLNRRDPAEEQDDERLELLYGRPEGCVICDREPSTPTTNLD